MYDFSELYLGQKLLTTQHMYIVQCVLMGLLTLIPKMIRSLVLFTSKYSDLMEDNKLWPIGH